MHEFVGWTATVITMVSFLFSNMLWLRIVNIVACMTWIGYGFMKIDFPVIATNAMIALIHLVWIIRNNKSKTR